MKQRGLLIALLMLCTGCQVTTESGMYRNYWGWRNWREPNLIFERYSLSEKQPPLHGHELKWHFLKWHDQSYHDPRYSNGPQPVVSQRPVSSEEMARQAMQKLPPPEENRIEKKVPEPQDDIPDVLKNPPKEKAAPPVPPKPAAKTEDGPVAKNIERDIPSEKAREKKSATAQVSQKKTPPRVLIEPEPEPEDKSEAAATPSTTGWMKQRAASVWKSDRITAALRGGRGKPAEAPSKPKTSEDTDE